MKTEHIKIINSDKSSSNLKKNSFKLQTINDFKIISNISHKNQNINFTPNTEKQNKNKVEGDNNKKNINNNFRKKLLFKGLKTETAVNINFENKMKNIDIENRIKKINIEDKTTNIKNGLNIINNENKIKDINNNENKIKNIKNTENIIQKSINTEIIIKSNNNTENIIKKVHNNEIIIKNTNPENKINNINTENNRLNNIQISSNCSFNIKNNINQNLKKENNEILTVPNKHLMSSKISLKKNFDLKDIKEKIIKNDNNNLYSYNSCKKMQKEGLQLPSNKKDNIFPKKDSPIIIKNRQIRDSPKITHNSNVRNNIYSSTYSNFTSQIPLLPLQSKESLLKKDKNSIEEKDEKNNEENEKTFLNDKNNNNINKKRNNEFKLKSAQIHNKNRLQFNKANIIKDDKDIYLSKDILSSTRYIKDEDIIDKPLLYDTQTFNYDKSKGGLENRIAELEYFTKKKLDELVKEIKIFIPIHFNCRIKNYSVDKKI